MKIGFFDSGLGGLTILKAVATELPEYDYEYYGDTANLPYGDKTEEEIFILTKQGIEHLFKKECLLVIVACNTASAETLRKLQTEYLPHTHPDKKVLGVIIPTIEELLEESVTHTILIGTNRTIESKKYESEIKKHKEELKVTAIKTPELVPLIEGRQYEDALCVVSKIIDERKGEQGIILGCTHYTILKEKLEEKYTGSDFKIFSQDLIIPSKLKKYLENHPEIETKLSKNYRRNIYLTDNSNQYDELIETILNGHLI
ncbi:MAG: glutamate racemase [Candidatus Nomurabacteria bacterium]|nr:MAG: glutamate racemase [Candidatus Nomurabacteria bacterium]